MCQEGRKGGARTSDGRLGQEVPRSRGLTGSKEQGAGVSGKLSVIMWSRPSPSPDYVRAFALQSELGDRPDLDLALRGSQ